MSKNKKNLKCVLAKKTTKTKGQNTTKTYHIFCDEQFERVAVSALKKVQNPTLFPRILTNLKNDTLIKNLQKYAYFCCFFEENSQKFANFVHSKCFDLGLFFKKLHCTKAKYLLKVYDGTGHLAGDFVTNIFDKMFNISSEEFLREKLKILGEYEKLDISKLLVQNI